MSVHAVHKGTCSECDRPIRVGQEISMLGFEWAHVNCPPLPTVCDSCFTEKTPSGACMCGAV